MTMEIIFNVTLFYGKINYSAYLYILSKSDSYESSGEDGSEDLDLFEPADTYSDCNLDHMASSSSPVLNFESK